MGDRTWLSATLGNLGGLVRELGDLEAAERLAREGLALLEQTGDPSSVASGLTMLAEILVEAGRLTEAREKLRESIAIALDARALREVPSALDAFADLSLRDGDSAAAARFLGQAAALRTSGGQAPLHGVDALVDRGRASLGVAAFDAAWDAGAEADVDTLLATIG
jgi:tetratricopeptide (TPR) repeat protein